MSKKVKVIQTSQQSNKKWEEQPTVQLTKNTHQEKLENTIEIDASKEYQEWMGFGGAFTEAAAYSLAQISPEKRESVLSAYFDKTNGLGYNLGRTHIHSCDFALENYTYVEDGDESLASFSIEREQKYVIPLIKDATNKAGEQLTLLSSPWSPPAWMKTNDEMNHGGKLKDEYRQVWANYYVKYIQEMEAAGIPIWGVSVQNEPEAVQTWDSCIYTAEEERDFVKNYLGPTLEKNGLQDKNIIIWDHNRDVIVERASTVLSDPEAAKYVWGTGNHWYVSEEFENLSKVHDAFPDKHLLFTEGCIEGGVQLGAWHTGERYARNIIGDMNNWLEGFIDWNIVLNEQGGPNHVGNYCDAPIIVDTKKDEVHYNSSYYYIGHFSKFIKPGARRIGVTSGLEGVSITAFKNSNGEMVVIVLNENEASLNTNVIVEDSNAEIHVPARSISTFIIN
ncbi:glycoside hydrolase family 30 protein [Evansella cellulosilytica]|uniref:Glucosylceramidase n=1 Tax=Evansella cellulosilytica (strain ATCC 21833 / DSM 2522 / FERM P-1141 / JCM 9156 / N-4) TaxID=649639 RepID=E6TQX2_EVAC2|nr:glycoside hydrolase family 30 protein [Evansella cellulosilytica]ADU31747.1 Glucosylceramidase [Evansella cellulosilytica DSM 2522]